MHLDFFTKLHSFTVALLMHSHLAYTSKYPYELVNLSHLYFTEVVKPLEVVCNVVAWLILFYAKKNFVMIFGSFTFTRKMCHKPNPNTMQPIVKYRYWTFLKTTGMWNFNVSYVSHYFLLEWGFFCFLLT